MFHIALFEPEIPPNTGNIIRLCANTGAQLHLIKPLGFELSDKQLRRAGLDYYAGVCVLQYDNFSNFLHSTKPMRLFACSTSGTTHYNQVSYQPGDTLLFGPETRGLPRSILNALSEANRLRIPMLPSNRSLNLSNAVAVVVFEAWRQQGFAGGK